MPFGGFEMYQKILNEAVKELKEELNKCKCKKCECE